MKNLDTACKVHRVSPAPAPPCSYRVSTLFQEDKITMLYEVREGACLESFGIHVATMAGFPKAVIREAKRKAATLENFEEAMERTGGVGMNKRSKNGGEGEGAGEQHATKLHRLLDMFKVGIGRRSCA